MLDRREPEPAGAVPAVPGAVRGGFPCLAGGDVGGKGEGLLRLASVIESQGLAGRFRGMDIAIPRTLLIGTDAFDAFLASGRLPEDADSGAADFRAWAGLCPDSGRVTRRFLETRVPAYLISKLCGFLENEGRPLIVRSSSRYEDAAGAPFSGIYRSYVIPNSHPDPAERLRQLEDAIRLVWASVFTPEARRYREMAGVEEAGEAMAIVLQELVGERRGRWFYPIISGTAQSLNYYPLSYAQPEDGLCVAALGLGSWVVEGGAAHRFCPRYPALNAAPPEMAAEGSQRRFLALDMERSTPDLASGENAALEELDLGAAEGTGALDWVVSTWDREDRCLVPGTVARGPRIMDFAPILKYDALPFAPAIEACLAACAAEYVDADAGSSTQGAVEIEFALDRSPETGRTTLYLLQMKALGGLGEDAEIRDEDALPEDCFLITKDAMGHGRRDDIRDILWVDPGRFDRAKTGQIAAEVAALGRRIAATGRSYILIGPGRWGTRDPWLGVPVIFPDIAQAAVIVETEIPGFAVDFSFGSHFLHNIMSLGRGCFAVSDRRGGQVDWGWLASAPRIQEGVWCFWTAFDTPLPVLMDGRRGMAVVRKPGR